MTIAEVVRALGPIDLKSVRRDPLLRWLIFYPILLAVVIRLGTPLLRIRLVSQFQFDIEPYYPLLASVAGLMTPMLAGTVIGFLLLDQHDDRTLTALQVTPLSLSGYFAYRIAVPTILSFVMTIAVLPLTGLLPLRPLQLAAAALASCLLAPLYALFLAAFAKNKVQGFALSKALGTLLVPPLAAYFIEPPWQLLFGLDPLYWPAKYLWSLDAGTGGWMYWLCGMLYQSVLLKALLDRLNRPIV